MAKKVNHVVLETQDGLFTVEYICMITGRTKITQYECPLTVKEIEEEYNYVSFPMKKPEPKPNPTMEEAHFKSFIDYLCNELKKARHKEELNDILAWATRKTSDYKPLDVCDNCGCSFGKERHKVTMVTPIKKELLVCAHCACDFYE